MPTNTINLNLVTYNSTTDSQNKFLTFRGNLNGVDNSNMTKIDSWAGTVNTKLTELENQKPTILINATWISMGYYEATSSEIDEYKLDMLLTLRLDKDNDGTTTIKINSLPVKSLMKYGADGSLVNLEVGDLRIHHEYSFRYDGTSFVWQGGTSADQMNIVGNTGEIVTVASDKTLETSGVALTNVAMKSQIKNNLTETATGNILDATQGKILDDKINVLKPVRNTTTIEYFNSWSAWAGAYGIKLDKIGNRVFCNGMLAVGVKDNGTLIFNIPEAFRPVETEPRLLSANDGTNQQVTINTAGNVLVDTSASTGWNTSTATLLDFSCSWEV